MTTPKVRVHIHQQGEKTEELVCNWCGLPHAVEPEYKLEVIERGKREIGEHKDKIEECGIEITPEETWTCGACYLYLSGVPQFVIEAVKTECDHEVPEERYK